MLMSKSPKYNDLTKLVGIINNISYPIGTPRDPRWPYLTRADSRLDIDDK